jgi:hypothetical protein
MTPILALSLVAIFMLPYAGAHAANLGNLGGGELNSPLVLANQTTGAQVQIMPTTAWVKSHPQIANPLSTGSAGSSSSSSALLPAPACTLGTDDSAGDAHLLVNTSDTQFDSLDFTSLGLSSDSANVTGALSVQSLSDGTPVSGTPAPATPQVAGGADIWYLVWNYGSTPGVKGYFVSAQYPGVPGDTGYTNNASTSNLPVDFTWGTIITSATGGDQYQSGGAATGTFDTAHNNLSITAPLSSVGSPPSGSVLSTPKAEGDALVGTPITGGLLETADSLDSSYADYHVGQAAPNCPLPATAAASAGRLPTTGSSNNLAYFGGPVVHSIHNYLIWWLPQAGTTTYSDGSSCAVPATQTYSYEQPASGTATVGALPGGPDGDVDYKSIISQYFNDVGGTGFYNLLTQYADEESSPTVNSAGLAGQWTDSCGYTSTPSTTTGPLPGGTPAAPIYQVDIQAEVQKAIQVNHWPEGMDNEYYVYTGYGATDCFAPAGQAGLVQTCDVAYPPGVVTGGYCAYHGDFMAGDGNYVLYADMPSGAFAANPSSVNMCYLPPIGVTDPTHAVGGKQVTDPIADAEVSITSHEQFETVNDPQVGTAQQYAPPLGWYDEANGEIGDKCAYKYGNYASDGSNINLHGDHYIVQLEYSNWDNGCALTNYQGNGGFGGASVAVPIQKGTNLISVPVAGITNTQQLVASMTAAGQLPAGSITEVQTYHNGAYQSYFPGKKGSKALPLAQTDGVLVQSATAGTWKPSGTLYSSSPAINLVPGWNLVAATYPDPGMMTDSIFNQIEAQNGACTAAVLTNAACNPTVTQIKTVGAGGQSLVWSPATNSPTGQATWPQTYGNQVPFTSGMWIYATRALTWTPQGSPCGTVDTSGTCS